MLFPFTVEPASFIERPNRFVVIVRLHGDGSVVRAHCADPGRLRELLIEGTTVYVSYSGQPSRKTQYDLRFVEHPENGQLVSLDTRLPNQLFWDGLQEGFFSAFGGFQRVEREVPLPQSSHSKIRSRIDFRIVGPGEETCWVEVKSVTLVEQRRALFPDAVTERGRRHVLELAELKQNQNARAAVVFIVQRPDVDAVSPHWDADPAFGEALESAAALGVELYATTCTLSLREIRLNKMVPVGIGYPLRTVRQMP